MYVKRQLDLLKILRDTLLGDDLPAWRKSVKRKPISTSKFYFFDIGVARFLQSRRGLEMRSPEFGEAFEAYIHHEIKTYCDYKREGKYHKKRLQRIDCNKGRRTSKELSIGHS